MTHPIWRQVVLGIDAAWTATQPSGVALFACNKSGWRCLAVAPSYQQFVDICLGAKLVWSQRPGGGLPDLDQLLAAADRISNSAPVKVIAIDMPLSKQPIIGRRTADRLVSQAFGAKGCAVHSPSSQRPGRIADDLQANCRNRGYNLSTADTDVTTSPSLIEVYPHTAILNLLKLDFRFPYKVSRSNSYWPHTSLEYRKKALLESFQRILEGLSQEIGGVSIALPKYDQTHSLTVLKRYEDVIDAMICAWTGMKYLQGECNAYGDQEAAIWSPI